MATFFFSDQDFVPTPPPEEEYGKMTLPQRSVISQLTEHLRLPAKQQLLHRKFIVITGESGSGKKELLKHILFHLDNAAHTNTGFKYLLVKPGSYSTRFLAHREVYTFGGLPVFYEEFNGVRRIRQEWGLSDCASELCEVKLVVIQDFHAISANDFSCLEYYLRRVAHEDHKNAPFANCTVICIGNIYMPKPLTDDSIFLESHGPWAVLGGNPYNLYKDNITQAYFLTESTKKMCPKYKAFLDRLKTGSTLLEDWESVRKRMIFKLKPSEILLFKDAPRLFNYTTNADPFCLEKNKEIANNNGPLPNYDMADKVLIVRNGFEKLHLSHGCELILTKDIDVNNCLKAGCVGKLSSVEFKRQPKFMCKEMTVSAADIRFLFVEFSCSANRDRDDGFGVNAALRRGNMIPASLTKRYCYDSFRNKFVRTFPFVSKYATTHANVQNIESIPRLAIKLGQNELRKNQDYSVFSKLKSFDDFIILDSYVTMKRMKVMVDEEKQTDCHKEYKRLAKKYEQKYAEKNVANYIVHRSIGGRGRPQRAQNVKLFHETYIEVE